MGLAEIIATQKPVGFADSFRSGLQTSRALKQDRRQERLDVEKREDIDFDRERQGRIDAIAAEDREFNNEIKRFSFEKERAGVKRSDINKSLEDMLLAGSISKEFLDAGDNQGAIDFVSNRVAALNAAGVDSKDSQELLDGLQSGDPAIINRLNALHNVALKTGVIKSGSGQGAGATGGLIDRLIAEDPELSQAQALRLIKGGFNQNLAFDDTGALIPAAGAISATGALAKGEAKAKETGKLEAELELEPQVASAVEVAKIVAKEKGEALTSLDAQMAQLPNLEKVVNKLSALGKKATFTKAGQTRDALLRQANLPVGEGAVSRAEFIATVDNEVLPLLRTTFGAAFTAAEGDSLRATLGNVDASPEEKDAILKAFIVQKRNQIESLQRQTGQAPVGDEDLTNLTDEELQAIVGGQ